jgi:hypothetical protein
MTKKRKINYFIPFAVIAGIGLAIYTSNKPFKVYQQEKAKADGMRVDLDTFQKNNAKMREKDQLMNPVQKEEEARRMGYVRPDETPLPEKAKPVPPEQKPAVKPKKSETAPPPPPMDLRGSENNEEVQAAPQ